MPLRGVADRGGRRVATWCGRQIGVASCSRRRLEAPLVTAVATLAVAVAAGPWRRSWKADPRARELADRHYNRQKIGAPQFMPPGAGLVLWCEGAVWITSTPIAAYVRHAWAGAWVNSLFRNERRDLYLSSDLILDAVAASRFVLGEPPPLGLVSFVDKKKTKTKRDPGRCYRRAGFRHVGFTKAGLYVLQLLPAEFPAARVLEARA